LCVAAVPVIVLVSFVEGSVFSTSIGTFYCLEVAVLISWSAAIARLEFATWLLGVQLYFGRSDDTVYAMSDREDDRQVELIPALCSLVLAY